MQYKNDLIIEIYLGENCEYKLPQISNSWRNALSMLASEWFIKSFKLLLHEQQIFHSFLSWTVLTMYVFYEMLQLCKDMKEEIITVLPTS